MKRMLIPLAAAAILFGGFTPLATADDAITTASTVDVRPGTASAPRVVVNDSKLKVVAGVQPVGPQTFAIDAGKIYVHDDAVGAVRVYSLAGKFLRSLKLPAGLPVADLAVRGNIITVLDLDGGLHRLKMSTTKATEISYSTTGSVPATEPDSASLSGVGVSGITYFGDQLVGQIESAGQLVLTKGSFLNKPVGSFVRPGLVTQAGKSLLVKSASGVLLKKFTVPNQPVQVVMSHREKGYTYYSVVDDYQAANGTWLYNTWVYKFADSGALVASYTLAAQSSYTPWREVAVYNGQVFQLRAGTKQAQIVQLTPDNRAKTATTKAANVQAPQNFTAAGAPAKVIETVLNRAEKMAKVKWTYKKAKHGKIGVVTASQRKWVAQAPQLKKIKKASATVAAYPYAWGGYDTDKTHSEGASWKSFSKSLTAKKVYVSNVRSHAGWVPKTAGVDCSGFVSSVFGVGNKRGTSNMIDGKWFKKLKNVRDVKRGDILNRSGDHVVLVLGWVSDTKIQVIESTTTTEYGQVKVNTKTIGYYADKGYTAARYSHWVRDPTKCVPGIPCAYSVGSGVAK
ncbi:hypothetical protein [Propionicimonas sp.]|uniref:hypothetical protein n=1 Tax=Propionicimonas sp. TaxID=1955623 RepID=UPI0018395603|nr:hypothetical protein [Propionicimonas sp.]MBU3975827.1 hypothetical protein [Actinomycetota bacterium]MBA3022184.1 hypothetical protein [Propionicimonas sp.]MBU3987377.1 hypothetical protein [Actinomycetota bacterium]MBU4006404.1 hypothetical protein [Actinomycetota bacterium]MBU4065283.1 hypothetical protein [Actinomycetota bacterium]